MTAGCAFIHLIPTIHVAVIRQNLIVVAEVNQQSRSR